MNGSFEHNDFGHSVIRDVTISVSSLKSEIEVMDLLLGINSELIDNKAIYNLESSLLIFEENKYGIPRQPNTFGLNHIGIRFPDINTLIKSVKKGFKANILPFIILEKPDKLSAYYYDSDSNIIELYFQKAGAKEFTNYLMETRIMSLKELFKLDTHDMEKDFSKPNIGHLGLDVRSLEEAKWFFHDMLAMDVIEKNIPGAIFFGYEGVTYISTYVWRTGWGRDGKFPHHPSLGLLSYSLKLLREPAQLWMEGPLEDPTGAVLYLL